MKKVKTGLLIVLATVALLFSCATTHSDEMHAAVKPLGKRSAAPNFTLKDANGAPVQLTDYRGKVVLVNFWATWCGPCQVEIPWFMEFQRQYKNQGFEILGVAMDDEGWSVVNPYVAAHKINYRIVLGTDSVATLYGGVDSLPTTFVLDREGKIASVHVGLIGKNDYLTEIQSLLGKGKGSADVHRAGSIVPAVLGTGTAE